PPDAERRQQVIDLAARLAALAVAFNLVAGADAVGPVLVPEAVVVEQPQRTAIGGGVLDHAPLPAGDDLEGLAAGPLQWNTVVGRQLLDRLRQSQFGAEAVAAAGHLGLLPAQPAPRAGVGAVARSQADGMAGRIAQLYLHIDQMLIAATGGADVDI